jgi:PIN domain nuclease of toxin-antitoxin system
MWTGPESGGMIYLDTHVVAWLFAGETERLSPQTAQLIRDNDELLISPMVRLELQYLHEVGRTRVPSREVVSTLERDIGLKTCVHPFAAIVNIAESLTWTRDPFDRIIVAQASLRHDVLVTRDETLGAHYDRAVW